MLSAQMTPQQPVRLPDVKATGLCCDKHVGASI